MIGEGRVAELCVKPCSDAVLALRGSTSAVGNARGIADRLPGVACNASEARDHLLIL